MTFFYFYNPSIGAQRAAPMLVGKIKKKRKKKQEEYLALEQEAIEQVQLDDTIIAIKLRAVKKRRKEDEELIILANAMEILEI